MSYCEIKLSILVISHNQEDLLRRCLESIIKQRINFPYEIIISDDASTDNTWEVIQKYARNYPGIVFGYQINSSDINPVNRSERCGYNKAKAYKYAKGKYFVNIDADDFLLSDDIYQVQVDMLEKYPECIMCMQNVSYYNEGSPPEYRGLWFPREKIETGKILNARDYILGQYSILNQAIVIRRLSDVNPAEILEKDFDDTMITLFHLQYGNIVCLNRADYAYVISESSINSSLVGIDREVIMYGHIFYLIHFVPRFAGLIIRANMSAIKGMMKKTISASQLKVETIKWLEQFTGFSFNIFLYDRLKLSHKFRKEVILLCLRIIQRFNLHYIFTHRILYALLISPKTIHKEFNFSSE